jgi:anthranilate phosphoribosyltransferase
MFMPAATLKKFIHIVADGKSLSESEMRTALEIMTEGHASQAQMGAFLMALRVRGETGG